VARKRINESISCSTSALNQENRKTGNRIMNVRESNQEKEKNRNGKRSGRAINREVLFSFLLSFSPD
jgi:hypothetical protein